jgi:hypothetical protein
MTHLPPYFVEVSPTENRKRASFFVEMTMENLLLSSLITTNLCSATTAATVAGGDERRAWSVLAGASDGEEVQVAAPLHDGHASCRVHLGIGVNGGFRVVM